MKDKIEFETFRKIGSWEMSNLTTKDPTCFNGNVNIHKYKITIEIIDEPKEVLNQRLQKLWEECDNHHHWNALKAVANQIDYELQGPVGINRKK